MYATHVPVIAARALGHERGAASLCTFVLLSIRWPFARLPEAIAETKTRGDKANALFSFKREGYRWIWSHVDELQRAADHYRGDTTALIDYLATTVPGLGIVKSAFVAQMLGHDVACFDSRNLETCEMPRRAFRGFKGNGNTGPKQRRKRIDEYIQITRDTGGAQHWWDFWCTGIAPSLHCSPETVSARHVNFARAFL